VGGGLGLGRALYVGPWQEYRLAQLLAEVRRGGGEAGFSGGGGEGSGWGRWGSGDGTRRSADPRAPRGVRLDLGGEGGPQGGQGGGALPSVGLSEDPGRRRRERGQGRGVRGVRDTGSVQGRKKGIKVHVGTGMRDEQMDKMRRLYGMGGPGRVGGGGAAHSGTRWASSDAPAQGGAHQAGAQQGGAHQASRVPPGTRLAPIVPTPAPAPAALTEESRIPSGRGALPPLVPKSQDDVGDDEDELGLLQWAKSLEAGDLDDDGLADAWG